MYPLDRRVDAVKAILYRKYDVENEERPGGINPQYIFEREQWIKKHLDEILSRGDGYVDEYIAAQNVAQN